MTSPRPGHAGPSARFLLAAVVTGGFLNLACPGGLDSQPTGMGGTQGTCTPTGGTGAAPCDAATTIFAGQRCGMSNCHGSVAAEGVDLMSPGLVARLLNVKSTSAICGSSDMPYLVPCSNPATGLLIDKLNAVPTCGSSMPYAGFGGDLNPQEIACINDWATAVTTGRITQ